MLKWAVTGDGRGSRPSSGRSTPALSDPDTSGHSTPETSPVKADSPIQNREVNNNVSYSPTENGCADAVKTSTNVAAARLPPRPQRVPSDSALQERNPFIKGSDPLYQTARGRLQARRSRLNDQINRELRLRSGAENLLKATNNRKLRETVSLELSFVNSNLQLLKEEMSDLNSSVDIYQGNNRAKCIPMIPLGLKETKETDLVGPFKKVLSEHYHEDSNRYLRSLAQIQTIRQACRTPVRSQEGVELLFKYYNHLYFIEKRLFLPQKNIGLHFEWYDSLTGTPSCQRTVGFEKGSVLFNIGALSTQLGARQDRTTVEGLDGAVENFQKAAGAFKYLRDHFTHAPSKDMQAPTLDMLIHLMLAQSQECLFEKRLLVGIEPGMVSHITAAHEASMVADMYKETHTHMVMDANIHHTPAPWVSLVQAKASYYRALAHYYAAIAVLEQSDSHNVDMLADNFDHLHVWTQARRLEGGSVASKCPKDEESRRQFCKSHLRQSILSNEDALRVHNHSKQLRKIDTFQEILQLAHDRSLQKFSALEEEDDFSDLLPAPDVQPRTDAAASVIPPDFSQYKVEDLLHSLGPLAIFCANHQWLPERAVEMEKGEGQEFGFSVRGDSPVIIAAVEAGSKAQQCGMKVGDFIVGVGGMDTRWCSHDEAVSLIRKASSQLTLNLVTLLDKSYLDGTSADQQGQSSSASVPHTPNMSQKSSTLPSPNKTKSLHKKSGSGSSGSGWTLRRKRSSSKEKTQHHLVEVGKTEIHSR